MRYFGFIALNFAAPIAFFWTFRFAGAKPAIALAVIVTFLQVLAHWVQSIRFSPFFIVASSFTVLFGSMDLFLVENPRWYRLQPFAQNFVLGTAFWVTVMARAPVVSWFAQALPVGVRPDLSDMDVTYLRNVTLVWSLYFYAKAALFFWLAFKVDLGMLIILRSIIGGSTLVLMFVGEVFYRKRIRPRVSRR